MVPTSSQHEFWRELTYQERVELCVKAGVSTLYALWMWHAPRAVIIFNLKEIRKFV